MPADSPWFETYTDARREWRWTLYATNGQAIAVSSEGYKRRVDCLRGIEILQCPPHFPIRRRARR